MMQFLFINAAEDDADSLICDDTDFFFLHNK